MIHTPITLALAALAWIVGLHAEVAAMSAAFYCGREHAQAEYRAIKSFYGGKRDSAPLCSGVTQWWRGDRVGTERAGRKHPAQGGGYWIGYRVTVRLAAPTAAVRRLVPLLSGSPARQRSRHRALRNSAPSTVNATHGTSTLRPGSEARRVRRRR